MKHKKQYKISFRPAVNLTTHHIQSLRKKQPNFCCISPIVVNVDLGDEHSVWICDGEYLFNINQWSGNGLKLGFEIEPSDRIREMVHKKVFEIK